MTTAAALTASSIVLTGLMAGLFFGWAVSVIPGTRLVDDAAYVQTMQSINRAILHPGFVIPFFGTPLVLLAAAFAHRQAGNDRAALWLVSATGIYVVGLLGVTVAANVPLNNALEAFDLEGADLETLSSRRTSYEGPWNRWHTIRTGAATIALSCAAVAAVVESD